VAYNIFQKAINTKVLNSLITSGRKLDSMHSKVWEQQGRTTEERDLENGIFLEEYLPRKIYP
jgi:hypothetical protein